MDLYLVNRREQSIETLNYKDYLTVLSIEEDNKKLFCVKLKSRDQRGKWADFFFQKNHYLTPTQIQNISSMSDILIQWFIPKDRSAQFCTTLTFVDTSATSFHKVFSFFITGNHHPYPNN